MDYLPFTRPTLDDEDARIIARVLSSGQIASGPELAAFEDEMSVYFGGRKVLGFMHGTDALEIALKVIGVGPGDEVIVPAMTFVASANVVLRVGARPVLVDVNLFTRNLEPQAAEATITSRTRVLMPVHFAGLPVDLSGFMDLAKRKNLRLLEDAAHAMGSMANGRLIGSVGDLTAFSFHPNKNMTTIEGGALVFNDSAEVKKAGLHRFHGITKDEDQQVSDVSIAGGKSNMTDISAALGRRQLKRLADFNARRKILATVYDDLLVKSPLQLPAGGEGHNHHLYAPLLPEGVNRKTFISAMRRLGIGIGIHYPSIAGFTAYRKLGYDVKDFPNATAIGSRSISLPLFPAMEKKDVQRVCQAIAQCL